jgi:integrase
MIKGHLQIKPNGKNYYAVISAPDENGKRKQKWINTQIPVKGNNKRKAEVKLTEILAEQSENGTHIFKNADFVDFMEQWLEILKPSLSPVTYDGYKITLNAHILPYFRAKRLSVKDITPAVIQGYINDKLDYGLSGNTVRRHLANISKCLDSAVKQNILAYNPVDRIEKPKIQKFTGAKFYNQAQIDRLLEVSIGDPLEIVILLTLFYGLRRSEVLGLKWDAIDFSERTITIKHTVIRMGKNIHKLDRTKNDSSNAAFPMPDNIITRLLEKRQQQNEQKAMQPNDYIDEGYICTKQNGVLLLPCYISNHFALLLKKNDLPHMRFHDLRHSSASYLKHLGFDLKDIQTWLRHKDIQTTMNLYTHLDMQAKSNIADTLNAKFQMKEAVN